MPSVKHVLLSAMKFTPTNGNTNAKKADIFAKPSKKMAKPVIVVQVQNNARLNIQAQFRAHRLTPDIQPVKMKPKLVM